MDEPPARPRPGPRQGPSHAAPAEPEWVDETVPDDEVWEEGEDWADDEAWEDGDYVDLRPPSSRGRRALTVVLVLLVVLLLVAAGSVIWVRGQLDPAGPPSGCGSAPAGPGGGSPPP